MTRFSIRRAEKERERESERKNDVSSISSYRTFGMRISIKMKKKLNEDKRLRSNSNSTKRKLSNGFALDVSIMNFQQIDYHF